jgi:hypothetical protein
MNPTAQRPLRFFISYRRRAADDARLAESLHRALLDAGCEVFIDVAMPVGIDWSAEIDRRIAWCDYLVVLLSEDSISSEMVQGEVRRAHLAAKAEGRNKILPIRVAYEGGLGYELDSYLGKLQYALWRGPGDDARIAGEVLRGALSGSPEAFQAAAAKPPLDRPEAKADMRLLRETLDAPGAPLDSENPFYVPRDADERIEAFAKGKPRTVVIKGPSQTGKSSLLLRYLARCIAAGKRVAFIDLMTFGDVRHQDFAEFAAQLADMVLVEFGLDGITVPPLNRALDLTRFVEDFVLPRAEGSLVLALDDADRLIGSAWQEDFYSALRGWDGNRTHPGKKQSWGRLGLALAIATDPKMLIESGYTSPFNVTPPIMLKPFPRDKLDAFNASYQHILTEPQLDRLYALLRGHPYLTPLAFYRLIAEGSSFDAMCEHAAEEFGPFGDHLRSKLDRLYAARLHEAMREIVARGSVPGNDRRLFYRLEAAGLAREEDGHIVPANELYLRFFKAVL